MACTTEKPKQPTLAIPGSSKAKAGTSADNIQPANGAAKNEAGKAAVTPKAALTPKAGGSGTKVIPGPPEKKKDEKKVFREECYHMINYLDKKIYCNENRTDKH